jgi:hypothetical protein
MRITRCTTAAACGLLLVLWAAVQPAGCSVSSQHQGLKLRLPAATSACRSQVYLEHVFSSTAILSYILFWMIFYNVCHVF